MIPMRGDKPLVPRNLGAYTFRFDCDKLLGSPRPRFTRNGRTYMPKEYIKFKEDIASAYMEQVGIWFGYRPVRVDMSFNRKLPKSRPLNITHEIDLFTPDIDNLMKTFFDALNGVAWADDRTVVQVNAMKQPRRRSDTDFAEVRIQDLS